jgi:hypothetical protein
MIAEPADYSSQLNDGVGLGALLRSKLKTLLASLEVSQFLIRSHSLPI